MTLLSKQEIGQYLAVVDKVPEVERNKIFALLEMDRVERCRESFLFFVRQMWPGFISGRHHQIMAEAFERVAAGELKRLIINMPPELWNNDSPIDVMQRHSRYVQASKYIDELEADLTAAREELVETRKDFIVI